MRARTPPITIHAPPPLRRAIAQAAGALLLASLLGVVLRMIGADLVLWLVATVVASLPGVVVAMRSLAGPAALPAILGILLFAIAPLIVVGVLSDARAIGLIQRVSAERIGRSPLAAGFLMTDGAIPRVELRQVVTVVDSWYRFRGGTSRRQDTYIVAPVVPPGWTPDQPVRAVAIVASRHELSRRVPGHDDWRAPGGLLRMLDDELQTRAVRRALQQRGLTAASPLVIGTWTPNPGWARLEAGLPGLALIGAVLLAWTIILLFDRARAATPRSVARRR